MSTATKNQRDLVKARKERSATWRAIHFFGSLYFALFLLGIIAILCATATFYESAFNTNLAHAVIYKQWWFKGWLLLLCINLLAVTLTRWPWQRKHLGFVITHYGIITLLFGAMIGSEFGFAGNVNLRRGNPPVDRVTVDERVLRMENPTTGERVSIAFDPELSRPSEAHPREIPVPGTALKVLADGFSANLVAARRLVPAPNGQPGIDVTFSTKMMGQNLSLPFVLDGKGGGTEQDFSGLAKIAFLPELPQRKPLDIEESQVVFAKLAPVIQSSAMPGTGIRIRLSTDGATLSIALPDGRAADYSRAEIRGKPQHLGDATLTLVEYWPDFVIKDGRPQSAGPIPNNPAVVVRIEAPQQFDGDPGRPLLEMAPVDGGVAYQIGRRGLRESAGTAKIGEPFALGWADWTAAVSNSLPAASMITERRPGSDDDAGAPGFRASLVGSDGKAGAAQWIAAGDVATLTSGGGFLRIGYGLAQRPIPFTIALRKFEVPRVEGTNEPANFIASVEFRDPKTGATRDGVAQMNHPASWPGGAFAVTTGLNYKFSQASWVPEDLDQTTLQVLYDPGWLLKWTGSLAICAGIFIMFYLRPKKS